MSKSKWTEDHFRKRLKDERERREWTQEALANMLSAKGIPMHWTTVAKIEKGDRSVRIDEAAGIADLFGISVDTMLGRWAQPDNDRFHVLTAVGDTYLQSMNQVEETLQAIHDRITDLSALDDFPGRDALGADCVRSQDLLLAAHVVLSKVNRLALAAMRDQLTPTKGGKK